MERRDKKTFRRVEKRMTEIRIIARLWGHIADLKMLLNEQGIKSIEQIETEMDETASYCEKYENVEE